jgi:hypothetical protein
LNINASCRDEESAVKVSPTVSGSIVDMWESLAPDVRAALVATELKAQNNELLPTGASTPTAMSRSTSSLSFMDQSSSIEEESVVADVKHEKCPVSGADVMLTPVERAPHNVFAFTKTHLTEKSEVVKKSSTTVTTTTKVVSTSRGWRNIFSLPISYDVNMIAHGTLFDLENSQLLDATGVHPEGYNTRFAVVDAEIEALYGDKICNYFKAKGIELTVCVINGGEADKRPQVRDICLFVVMHHTKILLNISHTFCYIIC